MFKPLLTLRKNLTGQVDVQHRIYVWSLCFINKWEKIRKTDKLKILLTSMKLFSQYVQIGFLLSLCFLSLF